MADLAQSHIDQSDPDTDDASALPELDEIVAVMRGVVTASDAWQATNPAYEYPADPKWDAWVDAFQRQRELLARIDANLAPEFAA